MDQLYLVAMEYYGLYQLLLYIRHHKDFTQHLTVELFWTEIREMKQDVTLGKMFSSETT